MKKPVKHVAVPTLPTASTALASVAVVVGILFAAGCTWFGSPIKPAKPADEVAPVTAYLTVTRDDYMPPETATAASRPTAPQIAKPATVTITDRSTIAQIAKLINALPVASGSIVVPCPLQPNYDLDFRAAENSPPVAQFSTWCIGVFATVNGQNEPSLGYGPTGRTGFLKSLDALLPSTVVIPIDS